MAQTCTVKKKDTLLKIANDHGFRSLDTLLAANKEKWPYLSMHTNVLSEGMDILIPDKKKKQVEQPSGTEATYTAKTLPKQMLHLSIQNTFGTIDSVEQDVKLYVNGSEVPIIDTSDGSQKPITLIQIATKNPLPPGEISSASVKITYTHALSGNKVQQEAKLDIGGLDPIMDPSKGYSRWLCRTIPR